MPLRVKNLKKDYKGNIILDGFNISFDDNVINCILGESGCGKTTLLNIIAGLEPYEEGSIDGIDGCSFSYIFQETRLLPWFTVRQNMEFVMADMDFEEKEKRIERYLNVTGLHEYGNYYPSQLSGGMKQRLSIARAFAYPGNILLMDEPFKALDMKLKKELTDEFQKLWGEDKRTVLFVTHELDEALMMADNVHILGGKPLKEIYRTDIKTPKHERNSDSEEIVNKRKLLYSVFTGQEEEE